MMTTINFELPDQLALIFEKLPDKQKASAAFLAAFIAQAAPKTLTEIFEQADKKVAASGLSRDEIEQLLNEIS